MKILFVCIGNICRSPTAHAYALKYFPNWNIESAGVQAHTYDLDMDVRMQKELERRGITFSHKPVQFRRDMLDEFDRIICMGEQDYLSVLMQTNDSNRHKVSKLLGDKNVPDPWYEHNFSDVCDVIKDAVQKLKEIKL